MTDTSQIDEHRGNCRRQTLMRAYILEPEIGIIGQCFVRDLSRTGARLELDKTMDLDSELWLKFQDDPALRYCTLKWQEGRSAGVEFSLDKFIHETEEKARRLHRELSWTSRERRSGKDRRALPRPGERRSKL